MVENRNQTSESVGKVQLKMILNTTKDFDMCYTRLTRKNTVDNHNQSHNISVLQWTRNYT